MYGLWEYTSELPNNYRHRQNTLQGVTLYYKHFLKIIFHNSMFFGIFLKPGGASTPPHTPQNAPMYITI